MEVDDGEQPCCSKDIPQATVFEDEKIEENRLCEGSLEPMAEERVTPALEYTPTKLNGDIEEQPVDSPLSQSTIDPANSELEKYFDARKTLQEQLASLPESLSRRKEPIKLSLRELNPFLICGLCGGYLYEASTITECMHTFCKTCIVRYTERHLNCPLCDTPIHPTDPFVHIRNDSTLQDIVYKLLPQVAEEEQRREKLFYEKHQQETGEQIAPKITLPPPPPKTPPPGERPLLPYMHPIKPKPEPPLSFKLKPGRKPATSHYKSQYVSLYLDYLYTPDVTEIDEDLLLVKRFVRVTLQATIKSLVKFINKKLGLSKSYSVNIFHTDATSITLMEIDVTLETIQNKFYDGEDTLMALQYSFVQADDCDGVADDCD